MDEIVERFFSINKTLKRLDVIRALCVIDHGAVTWGFIDDDGDRRPALFMREDIFAPVFPVYHRVPEVPSVLYSFLSDLLLHLYRSVLAAEDLAVVYGPKEFSGIFPKSPEIVLLPDPEWMEKLKYTRRTDGVIVEREMK